MYTKDRDSAGTDEKVMKRIDELNDDELDEFYCTIVLCRVTICEPVNTPDSSSGQWSDISNSDNFTVLNQTCFISLYEKKFTAGLTK